jgi:hypothetical protein
METRELQTKNAAIGAQGLCLRKFQIGKCVGKKRPCTKKTFSGSLLV